ncbi:heparinase II/III family protein [Pseudomonadales bacterium]|nr:heparinase II/III family protein [Pseudomonadales bacterium]
MSKLLLVVNTVKYLKWQQIYFRVVRKFIKPKVTDKFSGSIQKGTGAWTHVTLYEEKINRDLNACFLNHCALLDLPVDWNNEGFSKLWLYNLHYFEDLLANNAEAKYSFHLQLLTSWVAENPVGHGHGWEPYPASLRIVNILKAWLGGLELGAELFKSVHSQASYLSSDLEKHLLGNHYFINLKALLFAGVIFGNLRWINIAEEGLFSEIPEQILRDGSNFELSPMYHSLILVDMLDMFNLTRAYSIQISSRLVSLLELHIPKMLSFLEAMAHPDGGVSFFNDSVDGIAPAKDKIESYATMLGFKISALDCGRHQIIDNASSGYFCATGAGNKLIFDASSIGPDYIPAHGHADTLSFELSIGAERVFVNSGTSQYGLSSVRLNQRKTRSHNTVEIDGKDSSEVWSGFRVANRARILSRSARQDPEHGISLRAAHNGYKSIFGGSIHHRNLTLTSNSLYVVDEIKGDFKQAISRFFVHPSLSVELDNNVLRIEGSQFSLIANTENLLVTINDSVWSPQFGLRIPNKVIEIQQKCAKSKILFTWENTAKS